MVKDMRSQERGGERGGWEGGGEEEGGREGEGGGGGREGGGRGGGEEREGGERRGRERDTYLYHDLSVLRLCDIAEQLLHLHSKTLLTWDQLVHSGHLLAWQPQQQHKHRCNLYPSLHSTPLTLGKCLPLM